MRKLLLAALLCLPALPAFSQGVRWDDVVFRSTTGGVAPAAGVTVTVCTSAGSGMPCTPLATIYTNSTLTIMQTNPFTTDGSGNYGFWAPSGTYIITFTGAGITSTTKTVTLGSAGIGGTNSQLQFNSNGALGGVGGSIASASGVKQINNNQGISFASGYPGADVCAQINNALLSSNGIVIADFSPGTYSCAGGWSVQGGSWLQLAGSMTITVGATVHVGIGSRMTGNAAEPGQGTTLRAPNGFNRPIIQLDNDGHWQELGYIRIEGNSANQAFGTIAASGAVRASNTVTITTTVPYTNLTVGSKIYTTGVTDTSFNGYFTVLTTPSSTTFTYSQPGLPNATSGSGHILGGTDGVFFLAAGEATTVHNVLANDISGSAFHFTGIMATSGAVRDSTCFGGANNTHCWFFDGTTAKYKLENVGDSGGTYGAVIEIVPGLGSFELTITKFKSDSMIGSQADPFILINQTNGGLHLLLEDVDMGTASGTLLPDAIRVVGTLGDPTIVMRRCSVGTSYFLQTLGYTNVLNDTVTGGGRVFPGSQFFQGEISYFSYGLAPTILASKIQFPRKDLPVGNAANQDTGAFGGATGSIRWTGATSNYGFSGFDYGICNNTAFTQEFDGQIFTVMNPTMFAMSFNDEDTGLAAQCHRIRTGTGATFTLPAGPSWAEFRYQNPISTIGATGITRATNVVTITTAAAHNYLVGQNVTINKATGCVTSPNGTFAIASIPTATTFTYSQTGGNETCGNGTVNYGRWWLMSAWPPPVSLSPNGPVTQVQNGTNYPLPGVIFTQTATQTITNTAVETTLLGTGVGNKTLPANFFVAGRTLAINLKGLWTGNNTVTLVLKAKLGSTVITATGTLTPPALSTKPYDISILITARTVGASGVMFGTGGFNWAVASTNTAQLDPFLDQTATVDTTASQVIDVTATWGSASGAVSIQSNNATIQFLN